MRWWVIRFRAKKLPRPILRRIERLGEIDKHLRIVLILAQADAHRLKRLEYLGKGQTTLGYGLSRPGIGGFTTSSQQGRQTQGKQNGIQAHQQFGSIQDSAAKQPVRLARRSCYLLLRRKG
jgi:hypothetical protein